MLIGYLVFGFFVRYETYDNILCENNLGGEFCRNAGDSDNTFYNHVKSRHKAWFDIGLAPYPGSNQKNASIYFALQGASLYLDGGQIVDVMPYGGLGASAERLMKSLIGKPANAQFGVEDNNKSIVTTDGVIFYCNGLYFRETPDLYQASCGGDGWNGLFDLSFSNSSKLQLDKMKSSIMDRMAEKNADYFAYRLITYPIFFYIFLILSALFWAVKKAIVFVNAE